MPCLRRVLLAMFLVALPLATVLTVAQTPGTSASGLDLGAIDRSVEPCADFYLYACGGWLNANQIPPDRPRWSRFDELQDRNNEVLRRVLEQAAASPAAATRKIGDYYAACMDEATIERLGVEPLQPLLQVIEGVQSAQSLPAALAELHLAGVRALFTFGAEPDLKNARVNIAGVWPGGLGLPDRDYYFRADARSTDLRKQYVAHIASMLALAGSAPALASDTADRIMRLETALASAAYDAVTRRDPAKNYHPMSAAELQRLTPSFTWTPYLRAIGAGAFKIVNVSEPDFIRKVNELLSTTPMADLRGYLRWQLLRAAAPMMSSAFVNENFAFYGKTLQGAQELRARWRRCVANANVDLGEALGQAFVKEAFGGEAKASTLKMVDAIEAAMERDIKGLDWMTPDTKTQALAKLRAVSNKIGYPDRWRDYSRLRIERSTALANRQRAAAFEMRRTIGRIGRPVDRSEWQMTPPTVNAYYDASQNNINFPAGILQPPFFSAAADAAVNYGGAGAVIGHELSHGFDDSGRQFDGGGNLKDWWTPADAKAFEERAACLVDQYSAFTAVDDVKVNGKLTLGENTADNGGVRIALMAYLASESMQEARMLDGFTPEQRLFLGYGQIWCEKRRPEYERVLAQTDTHSPARYRVNGVLSNMPEFQKAFGCKADAPMVRQQACRVW